MRRTLLVSLALVIVFTLVLASAGTAVAEPSERTSNRTSVNITSLASGSLTFEYSWDNLPAYSYTLYVFKYYPGSGGNYIYMPGNIPLPERTMSYSNSYTISGFDVVQPGYYYDVHLYVFGKKLAKTLAYDVDTEYLNP